MIINFHQRFKNPSLQEAFNFFQPKLKTVKGIKPHFCPSIRDYFKLGWVLGSPINLFFSSKTDFTVQRRQSESGDIFLSPGVIGDPNADILYARIDTGYSFLNLPTPILATKIQLIDEFDDGLLIPPNVYPAGYSGPILIAAASHKPQKIVSQTPMIHLIPLTNTGMHEHHVIDTEIKHENFEGLYYNDWELDYPIVNSINSSLLLKNLINKK